MSRRQAAALERALLAGNVLERAAMTVDMHAAHEGVGLYCRKVCESLTERARATQILRSEHIEITAHLEAMRRMLEVSTRCLRF